MRRRALACVAGATIASGGPGAAQVVRGRVVERETRAPVAGAAVVARDTMRLVAGFTRTGGDGTFSLTLPVSAFVLHATRIGFAPESVATAGADAPDTLNVELEMRALPTMLSPVVIADERRRIRETRVLGLDLRSLSTDLITPSQLAASSRGAGTYLNALARHLPAGLTISSRSQCVAMNRGVRMNATPTCAMVIVDGVRLDDPARALDLVQPQWLDHAIFIRAADAGVRFGTGASGGVLLLFTTYGSYALARP